MKLFKAKDTTFENYDRTVRDYLSKTFSSLGMDYTNSQVFGNIYSGIKGVLQNIKLYIEDAFTEQNIYTASRKRSFYSLARLSGYEPFYGSAAVGNLIIESSVTNNNNLKKIYIKNHSTLIDVRTGLVYNILLPSENYVIDLTKALVRHSVKIVQGSWNNTNFTAKGEPLETFTINTSGLHDKEYIEVKVNGVKYSSVGCLYDMNEDSNEYVVFPAFDGSFEVMFGDGVHGKQLTEGDSVEIFYIVHDGQQGNIPYPGSEYFRMTSQVYDSKGNMMTMPDYIKFSLDSSVTGGTDADTISNVKKMIGYNSRSLVLTSDKNLMQFLNRFSFIGRTMINSIPGSLQVEARCISSKFDYINDYNEYLELDPKELMLNETEKNMVITALSNSGKAMTGITLKMTDPIIQQYAMICYIKVKNEYAFSTVCEKIKEIVAEYFMNLPDNTTFIPKSDIIKLCNDIDENIESFSFDFISKQAEDAYRQGYYYIYEKTYSNGTWNYKPIKKMNETGITPGLDAYGNIEISSPIEMPLLHGNFNYYPNKGIKKDMLDSIKIDTMTFINI